MFNIFQIICIILFIMATIALVAMMICFRPRHHKAERDTNK